MADPGWCLGCLGTTQEYRRVGSARWVNATLSSETRSTPMVCGASHRYTCMWCGIVQWQMQEFRKGVFRLMPDCGQSRVSGLCKGGVWGHAPPSPPKNLHILR